MLILPKITAAMCHDLTYLTDTLPIAPLDVRTDILIL
jgi:hypothetical protein